MTQRTIPPARGKAPRVPQVTVLALDRAAESAALDPYADHVRQLFGLPQPDGLDRAASSAKALRITSEAKAAEVARFEEYAPAARLVALDRAERRDVADPDDPNRTVRVARLTCHYDQLHRRGTLSDAQREACDRYLMEAEVAEGAKDRPTARVGGRTPPWMQGHPAETQVRAVVSLRAARAAVGLNGRALCDLLVLANLDVAAIADRRKERREVTMGQIKASLTRLAEHWGME